MEKRAQITVIKEEWEEVQSLLKLGGLPKNFMSVLFQDIVKGMLPGLRQAKEDQIQKRLMTQAEGEKRYRDLAEKAFSKL